MHLACVQKANDVVFRLAWNGEILSKGCAGLQSSLKVKGRLIVAREFLGVHLCQCSFQLTGFLLLESRIGIEEAPQKIRLVRDRIDINCSKPDERFVRKGPSGDRRPP